MNNAPTLSPADRLSEILLMLIQALLARAGIKLPAPVMAMIEAQFRGIGEDFARLAASVEKRKPAPRRRERRTRIAPQMAKNPPLPLWGWAAKQTNAGVRGRPAQKPEPASPLAQPKRANGFQATCGPPIPISAYAKPAPWHAEFVTISKHYPPAATASTMSTRWLSCDMPDCGSMTRFV